MTAPIIGTFETDAERRAAFEEAARQADLDSTAPLRETWDILTQPKPPVMREISVQARKFPPVLLIGILIVGYLLVTGKGRSMDWE